MLALQLQTKTRMVMRCEQLALRDEGEVCLTIFKKTEKWLKEGDHRKAIEYFARKKDASKYRSVMDFLSSELFGEGFKKLCFRYYRTEKECWKAVNFFRKEEIIWMDNYLFLTVNLGYQMWRDEFMRQSIKGWGNFFENTHRVLQKEIGIKVPVEFNKIVYIEKGW